MRNLGASAFSIYSVEEDGVSLQGYFKHLGLVPGKVYRLYQRYVDFNTDKVLEALQEMDAEREDIFQVNHRNKTMLDAPLFRIFIAIVRGSECLGGDSQG